MSFLETRLSMSREIIPYVAPQNPEDFIKKQVEKAQTEAFQQALHLKVLFPKTGSSGWIMEMVDKLRKDSQRMQLLELEQIELVGVHWQRSSLPPGVERERIIAQARLMTPSPTEEVPFSFLSTSCQSYVEKLLKKHNSLPTHQV